MAEIAGGARTHVRSWMRGTRTPYGQLALAGIAGLLGTAVYRAYHHDLQTLRQRVMTGGQMAATAAGPIEYASEGEGSPVLVIHGAGGGYDQGLLIGRSFVHEGFRIIAPSRFGYLGTPLPADASPAAQADAHAALLDTLHVERAIVLAASAGAPSAVQMALRHPERVSALILNVPQGYAPGHTPRLEPSLSSQLVLLIMLSGSDFALWSAIHVARSSVIRFLGVDPALEALASPKERERVSEIARSVLPVSWRLAGLRNEAAIRMEPLPLERIMAPTLVITAADDLFNTLPAARFAAAHIPAAELVVFETGGHLLIERQDEVQAAVMGFLHKAGLGQRRATSLEAR